MAPLYRVEFTVSNDWGAGFVGEISIANDSTEPLPSWRLEFDAPFDITNLWNGIIRSRDGNSTSGNQFGLETMNDAPHGLWARGYQEMMDQIRAVGFNTIRLPFSNALFEPGSSLANGIDFAKNPDLQGLRGRLGRRKPCLGRVATAVWFGRSGLLRWQTGGSVSK